MKPWILTLLLGACSASAPGQPDAAPRIPPSVDGGTAAVPFPADAPSRGKYVINQLHFPTRSSEARDLGCNLDRMGEQDNQLATIAAAFESGGYSVGGDVDRSLAEGLGILLVELVSRGDLANVAEGAAGLRLSFGASEGPFDGQSAFSGMGRFVATAPSAALPGIIANGVADFGPGPLSLPLALLDPSSHDVLHLAAALLVDVRIGPGGLMQGRLCGVVPDAEVRELLVPVFARWLVHALRSGGSDADLICNIFDTEEPRCGQRADDCHLFSATNPPPEGCITPGELATNPIVQALSKPDVNVDGHFGMSLGLGWTAVPAMF